MFRSYRSLHYGPSAESNAWPFLTCCYISLCRLYYRAIMAKPQPTFHMGKDRSRLFIISFNHSHTIGNRFRIFSDEPFMNQEKTTEAIDDPAKRKETKFSYWASCRGTLYTGLMQMLVIGLCAVFLRFSAISDTPFSALFFYPLSLYLFPIHLGAWPVCLISFLIAAFVGGWITGRVYWDLDQPLIRVKARVACLLAALITPIPCNLLIIYNWFN